MIGEIAILDANLKWIFDHLRAQFRNSLTHVTFYVITNMSVTQFTEAGHIVILDAYLK